MLQNLIKHAYTVYLPCLFTLSIYPAYLPCSFTLSIYPILPDPFTVLSEGTQYALQRIPNTNQHILITVYICKPLYARQVCHVTSARNTGTEWNVAAIHY